MTGWDTYCEIWINGKLVGESNNAFRRWRYDIKNYIQKGRNECLYSYQVGRFNISKLYSKKSTLPGEARVTIRKTTISFLFGILQPKLIVTEFQVCLKSLLIRIFIICASLQTMKIQKGKAD